jgi:phospholipase C
MFEPVASYSFPSHLYMVSGWSATCSSANPKSCTSVIAKPVQRTPSNPTLFAWTDITYLLQRHGVTWGYYLDHGARAPGAKGIKGVGVPTIWNVIPGFEGVSKDHQGNNVQSLSSFLAQAKNGEIAQRIVDRSRWRG